MKKKTKKKVEKIKKPTAKQAEATQAKIDAEELEKLEQLDKTTIRLRIFMNEYLKDFNGARAAIKAGYTTNRGSAKTIASQILLTNLDVQKRLRKRIDDRAAALELDQDFVIKGLLTIHDRSMQIEPVKDSNGDVTGEFKFDSKAANRALELIGKHLNMFPTTLRNDPKNPVDAAKTIIYLPNNGR